MVHEWFLQNSEIEILNHFVAAIVLLPKVRKEQWLLTLCHGNVYYVSIIPYTLKLKCSIPLHCLFKETYSPSRGFNSLFLTLHFHFQLHHSSHLALFLILKLHWTPLRFFCLDYIILQIAKNCPACFFLWVQHHSSFKLWLNDFYHDS